MARWIGGSSSSRLAGAEPAAPTPGYHHYSMCACSVLVRQAVHVAVPRQVVRCNATSTYTNPPPLTITSTTAPPTPPAMPPSTQSAHQRHQHPAGGALPCPPSGTSAIGTLYASRLVPIRDGVAGTDLVRGQAKLHLPGHSQGNAEHSSGSFSSVAGGSQPVRSAPVGAGMGIDGFVDLADPLTRHAGVTTNYRRSSTEVAAGAVTVQTVVPIPPARSPCAAVW